MLPAPSDGRKNTAPVLLTDSATGTMMTSFLALSGLLFAVPSSCASGYPAPLAGSHRVIQGQYVV